MEQAQLLDLARQLVIGIAPLVAGGALAKLGENATDAGEAFARKAWGALTQRLQGQRRAEIALAVLVDEQDKPDNRDRVIQQIVGVYQNDQAAIAELQALVAELHQMSGSAQIVNRGNSNTGSGDNITIGDISNSSGIAIGRGASSTVRNINTGGGDYAEGNIDKSKRVIIAGQTPATIPGTSKGQRQRKTLPATLSADGTHFSYGHALLIGVGQYASNAYTELTTANDATQLASLLTDPAHAAYPTAQVTLLQNQAATKKGILDAFTTLTTHLKESQGAAHKPTVVVFFAGHGTNQNGFALLPHDYDPGNPSGTTISDRAFRNAIQALIPHCEKLLVLLNCCYSGGTAGRVLSDIVTPINTSAPPRSFIEALATGGGQVVISSSRSDQPSSAMAEDDIELTTFGSKLVRGLRGAAPGSGPAIGVLDLFAHLASAVPADARGITYQGKPLDQHPLLYAREVDQNFPVALRPEGQERGTLDAAQGDVVQRLAQIELALFAQDRDEDAPELVAEREALLRQLGGIADLQ